MSPHTAAIMLFLATSVWAASFPAYKVLLAKLTPMGVQGWRYLAAGVLILAWSAFGFTSPLDRRTLAQGFVLGLVLWSGYTLQAYGIDLTTSSRAAFFTSLLTLFGPLFYRLMTKRRFRRTFLLWWGLALSGLALLTLRGWTWGWNLGDSLCLFGAMVFGGQMVLVDRWATRRNARLLNLIQVLCIFVVTCVWALAVGEDPTRIRSLNGREWIILIGLALFPSWLAYEWQFRAQPRLQTPLASLIYALEPLMAAVIAWVWVGETLRPGQWLGAGFVVAALIGSTRSPIFHGMENPMTPPVENPAVRTPRDGSTGNC